ncbi:MAG: glycosyltransferase [Planctomycetota bacterium]
MSDTRDHILASAYACDPRLGSEAGIGWHLARELAKFADVTLITRRNNVAAVEAAARVEGLALTCVGHDLSPRLLRWKRGARGAMPYYYLWQRSLGALASGLRPERPFTLAQHLTFASGWIPSGLATLDLPFVLGPIGQHPRVPDRFLPKAALRARLAEPLKALVRRALPALDPAYARTLARADVILSLGGEFERSLPAQHAHKLAPLLAAGVDADAFPSTSEGRRAPAGALHVLFAGRLVALKGPDLALAAFEALQRVAPSSTLTFVGAGPREGALRARVAAAGLADAVQFRGSLSHDAALTAMRAADVFLFPSFEGGGMVVPEAMAAGVPVVTLAHGGPGEMVSGARDGVSTGPRGIVVASEGAPAAVVERLSAALLTLASNEALRRAMGRAARAFALDTAAWSAKGPALAAACALAKERHARRTRSRAQAAPALRGVAALQGSERERSAA